MRFICFNFILPLGSQLRTTNNTLWDPDPDPSEPDSGGSGGSGEGGGESGPGGGSGPNKSS